MQINVDHPFFRRTMLDSNNGKDSQIATDYLLFAMAAAELFCAKDDSYELMANIKGVMSMNIRTLLN